MFDVKWTGEYPCLCEGEWKIMKDGVDVSHLIPKDLRDESMNTAGTYHRWYFNDEWEDIHEYYRDGLEYSEWIEENQWINAMCDTNEEKEELFSAIQSQDWRLGCCGGCI